MKIQVSEDFSGAFPELVQQKLDHLIVEARSISSLMASHIDEDLADRAADGSKDAQPVDLARLKRYMRMRRLRERLLPASLFAEPAWDMLLDLFISQIEGSKVQVTSACIAAAVPATTALRWIHRLEEEGLAERTPDPSDRRRVYLSLSNSAMIAMSRWVRTALP